MKNIISAFALLSIGFTSLSGCDSKLSQKEKEDKLAKEVIEIHDEVMPKMDDIYQLKKQTRDLLPDSANQEMVNSVNSDLIYKQIEKLDMAHDAMMNWMREYNGGIDLFTHNEKMEYLEKEKVKIEEVKTMMLEVIEDTKTFLSNSKTDASEQ